MILSLLIIACGAYCIIKTEKVGRITGVIPFAEKVFGVGGTYPFLKVLGLLMIILSVMWMTGTLQAFLRTVFSPFLVIQ